MTDAGFVAAGWAIAAATFAGYWARVVVRTRRAERLAARIDDLEASR